MEDSERKPDYNSAALYYFRKAQETAKEYSGKVPFSEIMGEISGREPNLNEAYISFIRRKQSDIHDLLRNKGVYDDVLGSYDRDLKKGMEGYEKYERWSEKNLIIQVNSLIARALFLLDDSSGSDLPLYPGVENNSDRRAS